jgi:predicted nucleic acid-binding protein
MSANLEFVDTNIIVYAYDTSERYNKGQNIVLNNNWQDMCLFCRKTSVKSHIAD